MRKFMILPLLFSSSVFSTEELPEPIVAITCTNNVTFNSIGHSDLVSLSQDGDVLERWTFQTEIYKVNGRNFSHGKSTKSKIKMSWERIGQVSIELRYSNGKLIKYNDCVMEAIH